MRIFVPKELHPTEERVPLVPGGVAKLAKLGAEIEIEQGLGATLHCQDSEYENAGAKISADRARSLADADLLIRLRKPASSEVDQLKKGCIHLSFLDPFNERELILRLAAAEVTAISMEMIPRTAVAQKMDVLSSQANLSGYVAVIVAAARASRIFPMLITPAGAMKSLRVFVIGVGVAGLQAIATARRLGRRWKRLTPGRLFKSRSNRWAQISSRRILGKPVKQPADMQRRLPRNSCKNNERS